MHGNYGRFCNKFDLIRFVGLICIHISNQQIHFETGVLTLSHLSLLDLNLYKMFLIIHIYKLGCALMET